MNDLAFVLRTVDLLESHRLRTWVAGGWGEELRGLTAPRAHEDVDLLYPGRDWSRVDRLDLAWIPEKRRRWKRAFELDGVVVELLLVQRDAEGWLTAGYRWPENVFTSSGRLPVASAAALAGYRAAYARRRAA